MKINNFDKLIKDYESIFDTVLDNRGIYSLLDDIDLEMCFYVEGDTFCVRQKKYYKNGIGDFDSKIISFNFELTEQLCRYIKDPETGEQCLDMVEKQVVTYLGYN